MLFRGLDKIVSRSGSTRPGIKYYNLFVLRRIDINSVSLSNSRLVYTDCVRLRKAKMKKCMDEDVVRAKIFYDSRVSLWPRRCGFISTFLFLFFQQHLSVKRYQHPALVVQHPAAPPFSSMYRVKVWLRCFRRAQQRCPVFLAELFDVPVDAPALERRKLVENPGDQLTVVFPATARRPPQTLPDTLPFQDEPDVRLAGGKTVLTLVCRRIHLLQRGDAHTQNQILLANAATAAPTAAPVSEIIPLVVLTTPLPSRRRMPQFLVPQLSLQRLCHGCAPAVSSLFDITSKGQVAVQTLGACWRGYVGPRNR